MGIWDILCCGKRDKAVSTPPHPSIKLILQEARDEESATLLNPNQDRDSILSAEPAGGHYGAIEPAPHSGLTEEQRDKIDKIGKEVGG
jgi:hypothetical protein